jgi:hypothetical protein
MEFNMLTFTKQDSILIAVTLGILLSVPLLVPAFYDVSTITLSDHAGDRLGQLSERHGADDAQSRRPGLYCGLSNRFSI